MTAPNWFVGLPVPAAAWIGALDPLPPGARLFHPDDVHLTVAFLGAVGSERARRAWDVALALPAPGPLLFTPGALRGFGDPRRPSAWSVEPADGGAPIADFIGAHRDALLAAAEARPDRRPPRPHATLARPKRRATPDQRRQHARWAAAQRLLDAPPVVLDRLALFTWSEERRERLFTAVATRSLQQEA